MNDLRPILVLFGLTALGYLGGVGILVTSHPLASGVVPAVLVMAAGFALAVHASMGVGETSPTVKAHNAALDRRVVTARRARLTLAVAA